MTNPRPFAPGRQGRFAFISHSHADRGAGFEFLTPLANEGYQLWYDEALTPTREWAPELEELIDGCSLFVLLLSPVSVNREEVLKEVRHASRVGVPILVIYLSPVPLPESIRFLGAFKESKRGAAPTTTYWTRCGHSSFPMM